MRCRTTSQETRSMTSPSSACLSSSLEGKIKSNGQSAPSIFFSVLSVVLPPLFGQLSASSFNLLKISNSETPWLAVSIQHRRSEMMTNRLLKVDQKQTKLSKAQLLSAENSTTSFIGTRWHGSSTSVVAASSKKTHFGGADLSFSTKDMKKQLSVWIRKLIFSSICRTNASLNSWVNLSLESTNVPLCNPLRNTSLMIC